jgi:predicted ArsR family transcriptional regulator
MAFGQQSGPPASAREIAQIEELLAAAGYSLREARHVYGLTQRQAAGKFSRAEAAELVARLSAGEGTLGAATASAVVEQAAETVGAGRATAQRAERRAAERQAELVAALPDELLADELVRRGWMCVPPS